MKKWTIAALFLICVASTALAAQSWSKDEKWKGPGWYVTVSSMMAGTIDKGPYASEQACKDGMPSKAEQDRTMDEIGFMYDCENLQQ